MQNYYNRKSDAFKRIPVGRKRSFPSFRCESIKGAEAEADPIGHLITADNRCAGDRRLPQRERLPPDRRAPHPVPHGRCRRIGQAGGWRKDHSGVSPPLAKGMTAGSRRVHSPQGPAGSTRRAIFCLEVNCRRIATFSGSTALQKISPPFSTITWSRWRSRLLPTISASAPATAVQDPPRLHYRRGPY